jgi:hypothetical protein
VLPLYPPPVPGGAPRRKCGHAADLQRVGCGRLNFGRGSSAYCSACPRAERVGAVWQVCGAAATTTAARPGAIHYAIRHSAFEAVITLLLAFVGLRSAAESDAAALHAPRARMRPARTTSLRVLVAPGCDGRGAAIEPAVAEFTLRDVGIREALIR